MDNKNKKKPEPVRIIVGILSITFILFLWIKKDIAGIYADAPADQMIPMISTTVVVSLVKVAAFAGGILLFKWVSSKLKRK